jgi:hypothetical protein
MSGSRGKPAVYQRNALAPGILAALICLAGAFTLDWDGYAFVQYAVSILALICAWFAVQARQWWWLAAYIPIAVLWNPIYPFGFSGVYWMAAHILAGAVFLVAGLYIKQRRA